MDKRFTPEICAAAQRSQAKCGVPAAVSAAQWAWESGYGAHMPPGSNNPFGIKAKKDEAYVTAMTWEHLGGRDIRLEQRFRKFASIAEAFEAHGELLATSHFYVKAMAVKGDANAFANALTGVYATDPTYGTKIIGVMKSNDLYALDTAAKPPSLVAVQAKLQSNPGDAPAAHKPTLAEWTAPVAHKPTLAELIEAEAGVAAAALHLPNLLKNTPPTATPSPAPVASANQATNQETEDMLSGITGAVGTIKMLMAGASVLAQYGAVVPTIVKDVKDLVPTFETLFGDIKTIVSDVEGGKYGQAAETDLPKLFADVEAAVAKAGESFTSLTGDDKIKGVLSALAGAVNKTPTLPSVSGLKAASAA